MAAKKFDFLIIMYPQIEFTFTLESIKWLDKSSYELACSCDRFPKVYAKEFKAYKKYVKRHWNKYK